jgi:cytoskeletal protein RodZ
MGFGKNLKNLRTEKGITLEEIHKRTKLHYNIINALEEDRLANINPTYIKGFIKIYCKALSVNPDEYLKNYQQGSSKGSSNVEVQPILNPKPVDKVRFSFGKNFNLKRLVPKFILFVVIIAAVILAFMLIRFAARGLSAVFSKRAAFSRVASRKPAKQKVAKEKLIKQKPVVVVSAPKSAKETKAKTNFPLGVTMHAKKDTIIFLKADGKTMFRGTLAKGSSEYWSANEKIEFTVNDGGNIDLDFGGQNFYPLGKKGLALKNVVVTKNGINIPSQ